MTIGVAGLSAWLVVALCSTLIGTRAFCTQAIKRGLVANPNYRSLHQKPTASGGGVVFSLVFVLVAAGLYAMSVIDAGLASMIVIGGLVALVFGFADDVFHLGQFEKLLMQGALAAWVLHQCGAHPLFVLWWVPLWIDLFLSWLVLVWLMNLYNFVDGIDGLAGSGAVYICAMAIVALALGTTDRSLVGVFALLAVCACGFLVFNWPPATVFMGDAGSLFLGYVFGALMARTITTHEVGAWTWLVVLGYMAGDTSTTTVLRMMTFKQFYRPHRSHAYQNLARIWGSHMKVVRGILLYQLLWLGPLAVWSILQPATAWLAAMLGLIPAVLWTLRFGPRLSSD